MRWLVVALLIGLALPAQAAAATKIRLQAVGTTDAWVLGDASRFATWQRGDEVTVMDDRGPTRSLSLTSSCPPGLPIATALGSGHLLVQACESQVEVHDLATGNRHDVVPPRLKNYGSDLQPGFHGVGSQWIEASASGNHWSRVVFHNWRTGEVVEDEREGEDRTIPDLSHPRLYRRLCSPLERPANPFAESGTESLPTYLHMGYGGRRGLRYGPRRTGPPRLELWRCGRARPQILSRCTRTCGPFELTRTHAVWIEGGAVRIHVPRSLRTYTVRQRRGAFTSLAVTGRRLLVTDRETVFAARLPSR